MAETCRPPAPDAVNTAELQAWLITEHERLRQMYALIWPGRDLCRDAELLRPEPGGDELTVIAGPH